MQVGNLVCLTRASIGIPHGSIALIVEKQQSFMPAEVTGEPDRHQCIEIWVVEICGRSGQRRRFLAQDLEVINAA
jgi:hypothetical protein